VSSNLSLTALREFFTCTTEDHHYIANREVSSTTRCQVFGAQHAHVLTWCNLQGSETGSHQLKCHVVKVRRNISKCEFGISVHIHLRCSAILPHAHRARIEDGIICHLDWRALCAYHACKQRSQYLSPVLTNASDNFALDSLLLCRTAASSINQILRLEHDANQWP
jgi:hypothetical protein